MNVRKPVYIVAWLLLAGAACASTWRLLNLLSLETSLSSNVVEDLNDLKQRGIPLMQAKEQSINDDKQQQNKSGAVALGERINDLNPMLEVKLDAMSAQISSLQERLSQLEQASSRSRGAQHVVDSNNTVSNWNSTSSHTTTTTPGMKWYCASDLKKLRNACAGESGVECTPETRASDCHSDEGCMGIDCLSVPAKCAVQRSKNNDAHQLQRPLCNRAQVRNGSWTTSALPRAPYIPMDPWQKRCATRDGLDFSAPWKSYRWAPDDVDCDFAEWDACTFCDVLAAGGDRIGSVVDERPATEGEVAEDDGRLADDERPLLSGRTDESAGTNLEDGSSSEEEDVITISFVGDSTTFQHYSSIALLLDLSVTEGDQHQSRRGGTSVTRMACNERVRLSFLRDDTLDKLHLELETQQSDIVVFNTGVHYRKDEALMRSINTTISTLENWQGICRLRKDSRRRWCLPILRTTVPGHPHCSNYTVPFNDLPTMEHRVQNANYSAFGPNYFWWKMKGQNRLVEDAFRGSSTLDYVVLDAYDVMMRRPDGHQGGHDCVHYCLPGPPDVLSRMLLHTLVRRCRVLGHSSPTFFVSEIDQKEKSQYFICNRSISLPTYHDAEPEPSYKNDTLLLDGDKFGRMGNLWRVLFHGLDLARDRNLSFAVIRTSPVGRQIMHDVQGLFPFLSKDQVETIFGFRFIDSGEDQTLYQYVSAEAAFSYGGNDAGDAKRKKMTRAQLDAIQSQRRRLFIEVFRLMALAMVSDDSKTARQLCKSIESTGMTSTDAYTVIHSRSFATEGRPQSFLDMVNKRIGVHESGLIDFPSDMIFKILQPLGLEKEKVFMISDGLNMSSAEQLSASPQFAQTFRVVSDGDQFSDLILAVMSDVFIGNPLSTFSTLIAQIRYALGLSRNFLHVRLAGNGTWETFCEDENCFYKLHSV